MTTNSLKLNKSNIRKTILDKVNKITDRTERSFIMKNDLIDYLDGYNNIALFASLSNEIDTFPLIEELLKMGKNIYLPKTSGEDINFYQINDLVTLVVSKDKYKVREPSIGDVVNPNIFDIIICPGVGFDKNNNRIGHGKGYYDRYLLNVSCPKVGLCYKEQLVDEIPVENNDVKMDMVKAY